MRIPERKRRQHHVWQHYLKSWATDNQIWCLRDGNTFCTNTINVAVDRDFYKLAALNPDDLVLIKWLVIDPVNSVGKKYHQEFLAALTAPARFVEQYKASSTNPEELDEFLDIQRTNVLEDYHAGIENSFQPLLDDILNGDLTFYSDEKRCITFLAFYLFAAHAHEENKREGDRRGEKERRQRYIPNLGRHKSYVRGQHWNESVS